ncbi:MAG: hypothetical protein QNJ64_02830 [Crocosphaera sp.]|nr:hypothetical protein [Crocosphaera sp.]
MNFFNYCPFLSNFSLYKSRLVVYSLTLASLATPSIAHATSVTFETDFITGEGVGTILSQNSAQIFSYLENNVLFTAFPFTEPNDSQSHFHLFDNVALPSDNIDFLMGSDSAGLSITLGNTAPTEFFSFINLDIREVRDGEDVVFEGFNNQGSTGTMLFSANTNPGLTTLDSTIFTNVNRVDIYYLNSGLGGEPLSGSGIVFDNLQIETVSVPETDTLPLSLAGLTFLIASNFTSTIKKKSPKK